MREEQFDGVTRLSNDDRAAALYSADIDRLYFVGVIDQWYAQYEVALGGDLSYERRIAAVDYVSQTSDAHAPFFSQPKFNLQSLQELDDKLYLFFEEAARETSHKYESQRSVRCLLLPRFLTPFYSCFSAFFTYCVARCFLILALTLPLLLPCQSFISEFWKKNELLIHSKFSDGKQIEQLWF